jgi:DNA-directed RNA polymerase specialized sigma24 family protein
MYEGGMTVTEIAALHDVNKSTVSRSVNRAKKTLQDYLQFCL